MNSGGVGCEKAGADERAKTVTVSSSGVTKATQAIRSKPNPSVGTTTSNSTAPQTTGHPGKWSSGVLGPRVG